MPKLARVGAFAAALLLAWSAAPAMTADGHADRSAADAVDRGLAFVGRQQRADGSFAADGQRAYVTGLGVLAYLSAGRTPDVGGDGPAVRRAVDWLVAAVPNDGYVGRVDGSQMVGQAVVTLAVAQAAGVEADAAAGRKDIAAVGRLVRVIADAQQADGGWRVERAHGEEDAATTAWSMLALTAAADVGVTVPPDRLPRATAYLMRCRRAEGGAFADRPGGAASTAATATAVVALAAAGCDEAAVAAGVTYLATHPADDDDRSAALDRWVAVRAARQGAADERDGASTAARARLLADQSKADGGWPPGRSADEADRGYASIVAVLTLTVPDGVLPVGP